jgi:hypothetical protein
MEIIQKTIRFLDIGNDARRQYIDALAVFTAREHAARSAADVRGGMYWKHQGKGDYLIRTSVTNVQKSLGPRSTETEALYAGFMGRKRAIEERQGELNRELIRHQRMNRALFVGRCPQILVDILTMLAETRLAEYFTVVGTHALYAYEAAAGIRITSGEALATQDVDLLWDTRKRISFVSRMSRLDSSMLGILKRVDNSFQIKQDQKFTAVNSRGFEVDILRREATEGDPHPLCMTDREEDLYAVQAARAGLLLDAPRFSAMIVSPSGHMARISTVSPVIFVRFKRWLAERSDRDPLKRERDRLQAELMEQLVTEYLPHLGVRS